MRIGLDFDNTIACYDQAIALLAEEHFVLPKDLPRTKLALRDFLITEGREAEWTAFQGAIYGPGMHYAQPFEGAIATMQDLESEGHELVIISHRTRWPYAGPKHDLHAAAIGWVADHLQTLGLFSTKGDKSNVSFLETLYKKLEMIDLLGCDIFLDDLPEVLNSPRFPSATTRILFDPGDIHRACKDGADARITSWHELPTKLIRL